MRATAVAIALVTSTLTGVSVPAPALAQTVTGRVLERASGTPVASVLVELLRLDSTRVGRTLSARDGRFTLVVDRAGSYLVRVDRLGIRSLVLGPFNLPGDGTLELEVEPEPFGLAAIEATGSERCSVRPDVADATATLWEQIRKVLAVTEVVSEERLLEFDLLRFERELDSRRTVQRFESLVGWRGSDPFEGKPADVLVSEGFIQPADTRNIYWLMPEAEVILSDAFLDTHCFHVVERSQVGHRQLGLAFEPVAERRPPPSRQVRNPDFDELVREDPADVAGVLWVDAETAALETLEYGYTGIRSDELREIAGGRAQFERLADGKWVVRQWWIRMPRYGVRTTPLGPARDLIPAGMIETGGELLEAIDASGRAVTQRGGQLVTGRLLDSDVGVPIDSSTIVRLSGTLHRTELRTDGTFSLVDVPAGSYLAMAYHPRLDTLGIDLPVRALIVTNQPVEIDIPMPSRRDVLAAVCPRMDDDSGNGVVLVSVTRGGDGLDVDPARAAVETARPVARQRVQLRVPGTDEVIDQLTTGDDGRVRFCDVPAGAPVQIRLLGSAAMSAIVQVPEGGFARRDFSIDTAR